VIGRAHHLAEDRLFDCYVAERGGETLDPRAAEHLTDCLECSGRYAELARFMDGLRTEAEVEVDTTFPSEWRDAQRQSIMRRIEHLGHAARVLSFPGRLVAHHMSHRSRVRVSPWAASAAAACLVVGVAVGMFYDARNHVSSTLAVMRPVQAPAATPPPIAPVTLDTDTFLSELERALGGPQTPELMTLDVLTPHVREIYFDGR
jgi:hypothetical protein